MSKMRDGFSSLLWRSGISGRLAEASARKGRFVLVMHGIAPERDAQLPASVQPHLTAADLHAILIWLSARYTLLTPAEFLESAKPGVLLTFDDGFANNAEVLLPILEEFDAPAVFFISLQHVWEPKNWLPASREIARSYWQTEQNVPPEKAHAYFDGMSMSQLKLCAAHPLITIGSHTVSHPFLSRIDPKIAEYEVANSKEALEKLTEKPVELFAYPTGDYDRSVVEIAEWAGYRAAFAVDSRHLYAFRYEIPRIGIYQSDPAYLNLKLSGLYRRPLEPDLTLTQNRAASEKKS